MGWRSLGSLARALWTQGLGGPPRSANGASSFHLWWELPPSGPLVEVSAVLEVVAPPAVDSLYFWALQVDFVDGPVHHGGGHTGLQWYSRFPGATAVNWGGYASQAEGGGVLGGSQSLLPGFMDEQNTRAYPWLPARPYRLRVYRSPERAGAWRAEVTDVQAGQATVIRDLFPGGRYLASPVVWSEVFAPCEAPSVSVRWSELAAKEESGNMIPVDGVRVTYQSIAEGGCPNTTVVREEAGFLQVTNAVREVRHGARLSL
jgi:hypothetical protein